MQQGARWMLAWMMILCGVRAAAARDASVARSDSRDFCPMFAPPQPLFSPSVPLTVPIASIIPPPPPLHFSLAGSPATAAAISQGIARPFFADQVTDSQAAPLQSPVEDEGTNNGGAVFSLDFTYVNRYVYRGVDHDTVATHGNSLNLLIEGRLSFDLGELPHPFLGVFTNIYDADPVSRFEEIRPYIGATWNLRPFLLEGGDISYIFLQREANDTAEVYGKITIDDSLIFGTRQPVLSPYVMGAYDYDVNRGWYFEAGIRHDFHVEDLGLVLTIQADVAYITGLQQQFVFVNTIRDTGWQHAEVGLTASYSLNSMFNLSKRFGEFDLKGYVFYDDRLSDNITANNSFWGGIGIGFRY